MATLHHKTEYGPYVRQVFELINAAYAPLYGVVELSDAQIERYAKKFIPLVDPEFVCFVLDEQENLVAFGVTTLDPSVALKHSDGRLFPFGWAGVLNDLHHGDTLIMLLTAVRPDLQTEGINAVMMDHVCQAATAMACSLPRPVPCSKNDHILAQWKRLDKEQHKRRRCFIKGSGSRCERGQRRRCRRRGSGARNRTDSNAQRAGS